MRKQLIIVIALLGMSYTQAQNAVLKPEKGGLLLKVWDKSFTLSDSAISTATFQFGDGTDIKYAFKKENKHKFERILKKWQTLGVVTVRVGGNSLYKNTEIWRIYKYRWNHL